MNNILNQIDTFFNSQKENEQKLFFILPILLFFFISYYFIYPITNNSLNNTIKKHKTLKQKVRKITNNNKFIKQENLQLKNKINKLKKSNQILEKQKIEIDILLNKLKFLKFDLIKWAKFYNEIPSLTKKYNLIIETLENNMNISLTNSLVSKKMEIKINLSGDFINFLKFINEFETKKELVKINYIDINGKNMILIVDIYGAKL